MEIHNFNAGPAVLPRPVLERFRDTLLDTRGTGMSILEWSHRSPEYEAVHHSAEDRLRRLLGLPGPEEWAILFLQGGASLQFAQVPMNLAREGRPGDYVVTGIWARKALEEARLLGMGREAWSGAAHGFDRLPPPDIRFGRSDSAYVHVCTNNTIYGTQFAELPDTGAVPLVCDMSSDILSRRRDFARCALIYAGAQKNLGPAGLTVVALRRGLLGPEVSGLPRILDYRAHIEADGLFHTPPVGAVYLMDLVLEWIEAEGGLEVVERRNEEKAAILYAALDEDDFYRGCARPEARSRMNVTFRLPTEDLERRFLAEARSRGFVGLAGHRSVGGIRASLYNALPRSSVEALAGFMQGFARRHWKFQETRS